MGTKRLVAALAVILTAAAPAFADELYHGQWWTDRDYGYSYGYDYYDYYGDFGYVGPGAAVWDSEWFPVRNYDYRNWGDLTRWFGAPGYLGFPEAVALGAKTGAAKLPVFGRQISAKGEVVETAAVPVGVLKQQHLLIVLKTGQGELLRADLGPALPGLYDTGVRKGRQVAVAGTVHVDRGQPLVLADSVQVGGVTVVIRKPPTFRVSGCVVQMTDLDVAKSEEIHRAVLLETVDGPIAVIVGPLQIAEALQIQKGRHLLAEGRLEQYGEPPYAVAYRLRVSP